MKKLLRFIITIAIIIGIVFGIKYLAERHGGNNSAYSTLTSSHAMQTISKTNIESGLDKFDAYLADERTKSLVPSEIVTSSESGELHNLRLLLDEQQPLFEYFYKKSALITKHTKDLTNATIASYNKVTSQIEQLKKATTSLTVDYLDVVPDPQADDFKNLFNTMVAEYKKVVEAIAQLNYDIDKLVVKDYLGGNKIDIEYVQKDVTTQIIYANLQTTLEGKIEFAKITEPLQNAKQLSSKTREEQQKFMVAYGDIDNFVSYIQSNDKAEFVKNLPNKASYEEVGKVIFNISPAVAPAEGEGA